MRLHRDGTDIIDSAKCADWLRCDQCANYYRDEFMTYVESIKTVTLSSGIPRLHIVKLKAGESHEHV